MRQKAVVQLNTHATTCDNQARMRCRVSSRVYSMLMIMPHVPRVPTLYTRIDSRYSVSAQHPTSIHHPGLSSTHRGTQTAT